MSESSIQANDKKQELSVFLFLTIIMAPILSLMIVGGYGFVVWMLQLLAGPPSV